MNSLVWMLYLADVIGGLGFVAAAVCILGMMSGGTLSIMWALDAVAGWRQDKNRTMPTVLKRILIVAGIAAAITVLLPDKRTIYAKAAMMVGDEFIATEEYTLLREILRAELRKLAGTEPKK